MVAVVSYAKEDATVALKIDAKALGFDGACTITDAETGEAAGSEFTLKKHDVKVLRLSAGAQK